MQSICLPYFPHLTVSAPCQGEPVCLGQWPRAGPGSKDCLVLLRPGLSDQPSRKAGQPGGAWWLPQPWASQVGCGPVLVVEAGTGPAVLPLGPTALGMGRDRQGWWGPRAPGFGAQLISLCSSSTELHREVAALSLLLAVHSPKRVL